ncbi:MAG: hypothetical protein IJ496_05410 [Ruminococcus sp.]|nr:hypothetical protein [Ruminococcus sp.]
MNLKRKLAAGITAVVMGTAAVPMPAKAAQDIKGDVTGDGMVTIEDATEALTMYARYAASLSLDEWQDEQKAAADADGDGYVEISDATAILTYYAQYSASLNPDWDDILYGEALSAPEITNAVAGADSFVLSWAPADGVSGYELYQVDASTWEETMKASVIGTASTTYEYTGLDTDAQYYFYVKAFVRRDGEVLYGEPSEWVYSMDAEAVLNSAELVPHDDFVCYDRSEDETSTEVMYSYKLTDADKATLEAFAAEHFTPEMSRYEKLAVTAEWIHNNVDYAYVGEKWNTIVNKTLVDAVFNYQLGQCLQYNGAMISMMAYMGYDVNLVFLKNGSWQHFTGIVNINGREYPIEAGNWEDGMWITIIS